MFTDVLNSMEKFKLTQIYAFQMKNKYLIEEGTLLYTPRQLFTIFLDFLYLLNHIAITILRSVNAIMVDVIAMINHLKKIICYSLIKLKLNKLRLIDSHS